MEPGLYTLQMACFYTFYATALPGNAEIYLEEFRKLIEFELLKPDNFLALIPSEEPLSVAYLMSIG